MNDSIDAKFDSGCVNLITISEDDAGQRIDNFLIRILKGAPRALVYRIIRKGEVRVNKGRIKQTYKLQLGDVVRVPPVRLGESQPKHIPSVGLITSLEEAILYEDNDIIAINKPSGLAVHGGSGVSLGLIEALRNADEKYRRVELVHRLDRDTSGVILLAKNRGTLKHLHQQFASGGIKKTYWALVEGTWLKRVTEVNAPLKKIELKSGERIVRVDVEGKASLTRFSILEKYKGYTLVQANPLTGRTHQIRVHCQCAGHAIVGDDKYCDDQINTAARKFGINRLMLHAHQIYFTHPKTSEKVTITAKLDASLEQMIKSLPAF